MTMHIDIHPFSVPSDSSASPTKRGPEEAKRARRGQVSLRRELGESGRTYRQSFRH